MKSLDEIKAFFERDRYVKLSKINIAGVSDTEASACVILQDIHLNAGDVVQGGLIFTLMDFAFGVYANRSGELTVTQSASISYLRPPKGKILTAVARPVGETHHTIVVRVSVQDELGTAVSEAIFNGYRKGEPTAEKKR